MNASEEADNEFILLGGHLALDLVNTLAAARGKPQELLNTPADLAQWWSTVSTRYPLPTLLDVSFDSPDAAALDAAKKLRQHLRTIFEQAIHSQPIEGSSLEFLNQVLANGHEVLTSDVGGHIQRAFRLEQTEDSALLWQVAHSALQMLTEHDLTRLHRCRNERCVLLFYDTTKSGTRHWCSLGCMNRARSRTNYKRSKATSSH